MRRASGRWAPAPRRSSTLRGPSLRSGHGGEGPRAVGALAREVLHFVQDTAAKGLVPLSSCSAEELLSLRTLSVSEGRRAVELLLRGGAHYPPCPERSRRASCH